MQVLFYWFFSLFNLCVWLNDRGGILHFRIELAYANMPDGFHIHSTIKFSFLPSLLSISHHPKQNHFIHFSPNFRWKTSISDFDKSIQKSVKSKSQKSYFQHCFSATFYMMDYARKSNRINKNRYILKFPSYLRRKKFLLSMKRKITDNSTKMPNILNQ